MLVLTTEPSFSERYGYLLWGYEALASTVFLLEYLVRLWRSMTREGISVAPRYILSPLGLADLLSFLPFFLVLSGMAQSPQFVLLQLFRLAKLARYSMAFHLLADLLREEAESLLVAVMLMFTILMFAAVGIYLFEKDVQPDAFGSVPRAMWWAMVTLTTVGYGDVTPVTVEGRIFAMLVTLAGVGLVSLPAGIIASGFTEQLRIRRERFLMDVEHMLEDDGTLSAQELKQLEEERQILGLSKGNAELLINQAMRRDMAYRREKPVRGE